MPVNAFAGGEQVVIPQQIFPAEFHRIETEPFGDQIHLALIGPHGLRHAEAAQRSRRHDVGPYRARVDPHMGNLVRPRHGGAAVARDHRANIAVRSGIKIRGHLARDQRAVLHHAGFDPDGRRVFAHRNKLFFSFEQDLDRPVRLQRQERSDRLQPKRTFRSETAAQGLDNNPDSRLRQVEQLGHLRTNRVGHLRRGPYRQFALEELRNGDMGFQRNMLRRRRAKDIFENKISLAKALFDIATAELEVAAQIAAGREILNQFAEHRLLLGPRIVDQRRGGLERFLFIKHGGQLFVLDFDER